jgi:endonuclease/exonuclease/phosphatase family metal-dependent hydrolase
VPPFPKPTFTYDYSLTHERNARRKHRRTRRVPDHPHDRLVVATWNLANLGVQKRRDKDYALIAEVISWFDLVAVQEVRENLDGLRGILRHLPKAWTAIFTDRSGNHVRLTFLYREDRLEHGELLGEISLLPGERRRVKIPGVQMVFNDFNRSPALCSFKARRFHFTLGNVHVYYGADRGEKLDRRRLEVLALAIYARSRQAASTAYDPNLMLVGDFNTPKADRKDPVFGALLRAGMVPPDSLRGTTVGGRTIGFHKDYDQRIMFPDTKMRSHATKGVFDFDTVLFSDLWSDTERRRQMRFFDYLRYYVSDHRVLWTAFDMRTARTKPLRN